MHQLAEVGEFLLSNAGIMISAISGVFALLQPRSHSRAWRMVPLVGVVGGMLWALAGAQYDAKTHRDEMESTLKSVKQYIDSQGTVITTHFDAVVAEMIGQGVKQNVAQSAGPEETRNILAAQSAAQYLVGRQSAAHRGALTIWVFNHFKDDVNFPVVQSRLEQLGATVKVVQPLHNFETNSVWWRGPNASIEDAKTAALIATSAGVQIRQVCQAHNLTQPDLIQIGGSAAAQELPVLTASVLQNMDTPRCVPGSQ